MVAPLVTTHSRQPLEGRSRADFVVLFLERAKADRVGHSRAREKVR